MKAPRLCWSSALTKPFKTKEISQYTDEADIQDHPFSAPLPWSVSEIAPPSILLHSLGTRDGSPPSLPPPCEKVKVLVAQPRPTLCDSMDCSLLGSSVPGILQARIVEQVAFPSPGDLPNLGIKPRSPALLEDSLPPKPPGKPLFPLYHKLWMVFSCKELMSSTNFLIAIIQGHPTSLASFLDYLRDL